MVPFLSCGLHLRLCSTAVMLFMCTSIKTVALQAVPVYLSEMAPSHLRGALNIMFQLATTTGMLPFCSDTRACAGCEPAQGLDSNQVCQLRTICMFEEPRGVIPD